jgi:hypothetical protein
MHPSRIKSTLFPMVLFGVLALVPSGCSSEAGRFTAPGDGVPTVGDGTAPAMPTGFAVVKATDDGFRLTWTANTEIDLAGYRVYVYQPSPFRESAYVRAHSESLLGAHQCWYVYGDDTSAGAHYFMLAAVDEAGGESVHAGPYAFEYTPGVPGGTVDDRQLDDGDSMPTDGWTDGSTIRTEDYTQDDRSGR